MDIIDSIAIDLSSSVNDLARLDPLLVIVLRVNEGLHVINLPEVVHLEGVFRIYFLKT